MILNFVSGVSGICLQNGTNVKNEGPNVVGKTERLRGNCAVIFRSLVSWLPVTLLKSQYYRNSWCCLYFLLQSQCILDCILECPYASNPSS